MPQEAAREQQWAALGLVPWLASRWQEVMLVQPLVALALDSSVPGLEYLLQLARGGR